MSDGIEKLQKYAFGMKPRICDDILVLADQVKAPSHYTKGGIETIDYIRAKLTPEEFVGYCKGNVIKYVSREADKGGKQDLEKAAEYVKYAIDGYCE